MILSLLIPFFLSLNSLSIGGSTALPVHLAEPCDDIPSLNQRIHSYVKSSKGKRIGRGECWDLAAQALNSVKAKWDGRYGFGQKVNFMSDCIFPGDILQFHKVVFESKSGYQTRREEMMHHTAVIYEVLGPGKYIIAHQNANGVRKVTHTEINMADLKKGTITFFRPQN